jgi:hypothetical protein
MPRRHEVFICGGKKCSRACGHDALIRTLCKRTDVRIVRCQKICHGSVVVAVLDGSLEWFEYVDSAKVSVNLRQAIDRGSRKRMPRRLRKKRLRARRGQLPR